MDTYVIVNPSRHSSFNRIRATVEFGDDGNDAAD
jgi:hypothetical protein